MIWGLFGDPLVVGGEREGAAAPSHEQGGSGGAAGPPSCEWVGVPPPTEGPCGGECPVVSGGGTPPH